jgi:hypothetical protein
MLGEHNNAYFDIFLHLEVIVLFIYLFVVHLMALTASVI